ncbi:hypothetical protein QR510_30850, partial [Escherichia coli]|uniref:hypothetical protein n=1 Tax=Escherichia coli TaxID=562 RepID=UPI0027393558
MVPPKLNYASPAEEPEDADIDGDIPAEIEAAAAAGWQLPPNIAQLPSADRREQLRILEALLFAASEP